MKNKQFDADDDISAQANFSGLVSAAASGLAEGESSGAMTHSQIVGIKGLSGAHPKEFASGRNLGESDDSSSIKLSTHKITVTAMEESVKSIEGIDLKVPLASARPMGLDSPSKKQPNMNLNLEGVSSSKKAKAFGTARKSVPQTVNNSPSKTLDPSPMLFAGLEVKEPSRRMSNLNEVESGPANSSEIHSSHKEEEDTTELSDSKPQKLDLSMALKETEVED